MDRPAPLEARGGTDNSAFIEACPPSVPTARLVALSS